MSRYLTKTENDETIEEIESMEKCKWLINEVCCNDKSDCLGDFPYPSSICESIYGCGCFEKEDGIIEGKEK